MAYQDTPEYGEEFAKIMAMPQAHRRVLARAAMDKKFKDRELRTRLLGMVQQADEKYRADQLDLQRQSLVQRGTLQRERMAAEQSEAQNALDAQSRGYRQALPWQIGGLALQAGGAFNQYRKDRDYSDALRKLTGLYSR